MTAGEHKSEFELMKHMLYLALTAFCENFDEIYTISLCDSTLLFLSQDFVCNGRVSSDDLWLYDDKTQMCLHEPSWQIIRWVGGGHHWWTRNDDFTGSGNGLGLLWKIPVELISPDKDFLTLFLNVCQLCLFNDLVWKAVDIPHFDHIFNVLSS